MYIYDLGGATGAKWSPETCWAGVLCVCSNTFLRASAAIEKRLHRGCEHMLYQCFCRTYYSYGCSGYENNRYNCFCLDHLIQIKSSWWKINILMTL